MVPYTYLIGWSKIDRWYYGSEYKKSAHPSNLWTKYFTSSKWVKYARAFHGEPNVIEVRKIFDSVDKCREWEHKVLKKMKVVKSDRWLNRTDNKSFDPEDCKISGKENKGKKHSWLINYNKNRILSKETLNKMSEKRKQYWENLTIEQKDKLILKLLPKSPTQGKHWKIKNTIKMRESQVERWKNISEEQRQKFKETARRVAFKRWENIEYRKKMKESQFKRFTLRKAG